MNKLIIIESSSTRYERALSEDEHDMGVLFSYGRFMCEDKKDFAAGVSLYKRSLAEDPSDIDTLGNCSFLILIFVYSHKLSLLFALSYCQI